MEDAAEDLCYRCASIDWDHLEQEQERFSSLWGGDQPLLGDVQTSSCRICRLIISAIMPKLVGHTYRQLVVDVEWEPLLGKLENDCLGSLILSAIPKGFAGELSLTTESIGEDAKAWSTTASKRVDFARVKSWLETCKASHESCEPEASPQLLNLRVIDCFKQSVEVAPEGCSFAALSYVWGELPADSYVLGSRIAFPPTIEDAVRTTRELGYEYLWVDRYCINQEDPCDKEQQISQMGSIYASAQVAIVAAAGADPSYGLVGVSRDRTVQSTRESVGSSRSLCLYPEAVEDYIARSTWFSRAWTLQEGYLSKRILCFTEREAVFTCKSCSWIPESTPRERWYDPGRDRDEEHVRTALSSQVASLHDATNIMRTYSRRVRGHESDMLNAVVGILNVLKNCRSPIYHIWGVPFTITRRLDATHSADSTVSICLNWCRFGSARRLPEFPSWSTLGWIGQFEYRLTPEVTPHFMIKYWSGERYQELDKGACDLNYTFCRDVTHQSQYLEITTDIVQVELHSGLFGDSFSYFIQPTFTRQKEVKDQKDGTVVETDGAYFSFVPTHDSPNRDVQSPLFWLMLDDETTFDDTLPVVCATITPPNIDSGSRISFGDKFSLLLVFQQKGKFYERIGACQPNMYAMGQYIYSDQNKWEFVPRGEPGAWDQVAERRTFLLG